MNGVHDLGGLQCFGKIDNKGEDVKFVEDWERRLFASTLCSFGALGPIDAFRHAIEKMDPVHYLSSSYYEHWLEAVEARIQELNFTKADIGVPLTPTDIESIIATGALYSREVVPGIDPIEVGREVRALPYSPEGHTRLPNYIKGKKGTITELRGTFVFPDTLAHGLGECEQPLYSVRFSSKELWTGRDPANDAVHIDLWHSYLEVCDV